MKNDKNRIDLSKYSRSELEQEYIKLHSELLKEQAKVNWYVEQFTLSQQHRFGRSSEQHIEGQMSLDDINLFNEAETFREMLNIEPKDEELLKGEHQEENKSSKKSKKNKRKKDIAALPVQEFTYKLSEEEQVCPNCGAPLHFVKDVIRTEIVVTPATVKVHKYVSAQYACRTCEKEDTSTFVTAPGAPVALFAPSKVAPSTLAEILSKKYEMAVPFYRQEADFKHKQIPITRNNMCHWSIKASELIITPIIDQMQQTLMQEIAIHCDETHTRVIVEPNRVAKDQSHVWVTTSAEYQKETPMAIYNYRPGRSDDDARAVLRDYKGYVMCDGYGCYDSITHTSKRTKEPALELKTVACMVHVRRKFVEALQVVNPKYRDGTSAQLAIAKLSNIFDIDNKIEYQTYEERKEKRLEVLKPAMDDFFAWAEKESEQALPKSKYGDAVNYACGQKEKAMRVFEDGRLELENNMAERAVKPFVIGRKNWMFSDTVRGADASCKIYSLIETAKMNQLIPYEYLNYIFEQCRGKGKITPEEAKKLLPWSKSLPSHLKTPSGK